MTPALAVAAGHTVVTALGRHLERSHPGGAVGWVRQGDHGVGWDARHRWVSAHDDGTVLVVVDGLLHEPAGPAGSPAADVHQRYLRHGPELATDLLGDFVLVVLDRARGALVISRDPVGVRPWYEAETAGGYAGASDMATLCELPGVDRTVDEQEALVFLSGLSRSRGRTLLRGVTTLPPGTTRTTRTTKSHLASESRTWRHHTWRIIPEPDVGWDDAIQRCRSALDRAVADRIRAMGSATSELSGGLDSSTVTGTAALLGHPDLLVGRLLFEGVEADERQFSDAVIAHWGLRHISVPPWRPNEDEVAAWAASLQRPLPDPNFSMFVTLYRAFLANGRTAAMTGLGGDDAFVAVSRQARVRSALRRGQIGRLAGVVRQDGLHPREAWRSTWRPLLRSVIPRRPRYVPEYIARPAAEAVGLPAIWGEADVRLTGDPAVDERAGGLTSGYLAAILEEAALAHDLTGWRGTHPMLDPRVIEATYGLDPWFTVRSGRDRSLQVAAFGPRLPQRVRMRSGKAEFSQVAWGGKAGSSGVEDLATGPLRARGWLDEPGLAQLRARVRDRDPSVARPISRARSLDRWLRSIGG